MNWLRSLIFNVLFLAGTGLILIVVSPVLLMTTRHALKFVAWWSTIQAAMLRVVVGLDHEVRGLENIPEGGFIIASKHQSAWDTFFFFVMFRNPAYVLKKELLNIPVWGLYVRKCRAIVVDRDGGASAMKALIRDTRDRLAAGRPVVIFPEGTRTAPGTRLDYHPGIAAMYAQCDVPVVPVAVNSGVFWGRRSYRKQPGTVTAEFLTPIMPGLKRREFMARLEDAIEGASTRLVEEAWARFPATLAQAESADPAPTAAAADGDSPTEVEKNHPQPVGVSVDKSDI